MSKEYYLNNLYPLQDKVLLVLNQLDNDFYLTGGTVLSRFMFGHRYSDDLYFFVNHNPIFKEQYLQAYRLLVKHFSIEINNQQESFARFYVVENDLKLKIEWVNDVGYHAGGFTSNELYSKLDGYINILSNKTCALTRVAPKDHADLLFLSYNYSFNWKNIMDDVREKDAWISEEKVNEYLCTFNPADFKNVNWDITPNIEKYSKDLITIAKDILLGNDNSLCNK